MMLSDVYLLGVTKNHRNLKKLKIPYPYWLQWIQNKYNNFSRIFLSPLYDN